MALSRVGAPPGIRSLSRAWSWLTSRVRWVVRLLRRSSSSTSTVVRSSATTGLASPCRAATLAAAAASMTSFLRRPPRESSRTRRGRGRGHVVDVFAARDEPLREVPAQAAGVLHRPGVLGETVRPARQLPVAGQRRVDLQRREAPVRRRVDRGRGVHPLVRIDPDDDHDRAPSSIEPGWGPWTTDRLEVSRCLINPLLSQSTAWRRPARQTLVKPAKRRHVGYESGQSAPLQTLGPSRPDPRPHTSRSATAVAPRTGVSHRRAPHEGPVTDVLRTRVRSQTCSARGSGHRRAPHEGGRSDGKDLVQVATKGLLHE